MKYELWWTMLNLQETDTMKRRKQWLDINTNEGGIHYLFQTVSQLMRPTDGSTKNWPLFNTSCGCILFERLSTAALHVQGNCVHG